MNLVFWLASFDSHILSCRASHRPTIHGIQVHCLIWHHLCLWPAGCLFLSWNKDTKKWVENDWIILNSCGHRWPLQHTHNCWKVDVVSDLTTSTSRGGFRPKATGKAIGQMPPTVNSSYWNMLKLAFLVARVFTIFFHGSASRFAKIDINRLSLQLRLSPLQKGSIFFTNLHRKGARHKSLNKRQQGAARWLSLRSPWCCLWSPNLDPGNHPPVAALHGCPAPKSKVGLWHPKCPQCYRIW